MIENYFTNLNQCYIIAETGVNHNGNMILARKMSKDFENGPLAFEPAHFKNNFISKPSVGTNFRIIDYFLVANEKNAFFNLNSIPF